MSVLKISHKSAQLFMCFFYTLTLRHQSLREEKKKIER